jgi:hypothetical protein
MKKDDAHSSSRSAWVHVPKPEREDDDSGSCCSRGLAIFDSFLPQVVQEAAVASAVKMELHHVLNAFQSSPTYGVHVCESFKDPRRHNLDDYWTEVELEAFSIEELHHIVGGTQRQPSELSNCACARLHQFARALERLSRRIDRVVLQATPPAGAASHDSEGYSLV